MSWGSAISSKLKMIARKEPTLRLHWLFVVFAAFLLQLPLEAQVVKATAGVDGMI